MNSICRPGLAQVAEVANVFQGCGQQDSLAAGKGFDANIGSHRFCFITISSKLELPRKNMEKEFEKLCGYLQQSQAIPLSIRTAFSDHLVEHRWRCAGFPKEFSQNKSGGAESFARGMTTRRSPGGLRCSCIRRSCGSGGKSGMVLEPWRDSGDMCSVHYYHLICGRGK